MEFETTILGGLPVLVKFSLAPSEPDVGLMNEYVDEYQLCSVKTGKPLGRWAQRRLEETKGEDALICEMFEHAYGLSQQTYIDICESYY